MESMLGGDVICQASEVTPTVFGVPLHHDVELVRHHLTARRRCRPGHSRSGPGGPEEEDKD